MPFALRTSPPVARLNRWSDQTAISAKPSWRLRICSHMAKVSWEYSLENCPEPQCRSAILIVPNSWGFLTGMVRRRMESMSWKMAVLAPIPRARVRTATKVKPGLRRRNRKAWRRSRQNEVIAFPLAVSDDGQRRMSRRRAPKTDIQRSFPGTRPPTAVGGLLRQALRLGAAQAAVWAAAWAGADRRDCR